MKGRFINLNTCFYFRQIQEREGNAKLRNYENASAAANNRLKRQRIHEVEEEDDYSMIESQLEKQRRLKLTSSVPHVNAESFIQQVIA